MSVIVSCEYCSQQFKAPPRGQPFCSKYCHTQWRWHRGEGRLSAIFAYTSSAKCIEWPHSKDRLGYGVACFRGVTWSAHRLCYAWHNDGIPAGMNILHSCDNRGCVNAAHLRAGTQRENVMDAVIRGRWTCQKGVDSVRAKLTEADVRFIRQSSESSCELGRRLGVNNGTIACVRLGRTWRHVA